MVLGEVPFF